MFQRQLEQFAADARSMHANGVYFCFCDGSVHWISDFIEVSHQSRLFLRLGPADPFGRRQVDPRGILLDFPFLARSR